MKKSKVILAGALALGLGLGGVALAGCGEKEIQPTIEVIQEFKNEYYIGDTEVDTTGALFRYVDENGKETFLTDEDVTISGFFSTTAGEWSMVIKYEDTTILYPYTVIEPAFVEYGVPYYVSIEAMGAPAEVMHSVFIFTEDGEIELWTTAVLPTINNAEELFKEETEYTMCAGVVEEYEKTIVDGKYVLRFDMVIGQDSAETAVVIEDQNTIKVEQIIQTEGDPYTVILNKAGNEDAGIEYGAYYYSEDPNNNGGTPWYIVYQFTKDGKVNLSSKDILPTADNLDAILADGVATYDYVSYVEGDDLVLDMGYFCFHLDSEGNITNVARGTGEGGTVIIETFALTKIA